MSSANDSTRSLIAAVDSDRLRHDVFTLSRDLVPCRVLNYSLAGHNQSTLDMADSWLERRLASFGYRVDRQSVRVQAFVHDPMADWGFRKPHPDETWYRAFNLLFSKPGREDPRSAVLLVAHKDSQSWLDRAPGAYDNAVGVAALLEIARILSRVALRKSVMYLFCNEEHWPWTSVAAAEKLAQSDLTIETVINVDSIGGRSPAEIAAGRHTNVTRFTTPEGERIADLMSEMNRVYEIGLEQSKRSSDRPNDDDGSFVNAGILPAVLNIGSLPYADDAYHTIQDRPERVDIDNVAKATRLTLATTIEIAG